MGSKPFAADLSWKKKGCDVEGRYMPGIFLIPDLSNCEDIHCLLLA